MNALKQEIIDKYSASTDKFFQLCKLSPSIAVVAGSGIADAIGSSAIIQEIDYSELPGFPQITVQGHSGKIALVEYEGKTAALFTGRFHLYEGKSVEEICSISILSKLIGINSIIMTNAAGGMNVNFNPGEIMLISDFMNFTYKSIKTLIDTEKLSECALSEDTIDTHWLNAIKTELTNSGIFFREGVYNCVTGPTYETPAEIRAYRRLGSDAMGMSTVLEGLLAKKMGMKVSACSVITNKLLETGSLCLTHDEVLEISKKAADNVNAYIKAAIKIG